MCGSTYNLTLSHDPGEGQFFWIDAIATDSLGNIYTGEVNSGKAGSEIRAQER